MELNYICISDKGLRRTENQDCFWADGYTNARNCPSKAEIYGSADKNTFFAVFDGMGGLSQGGTASGLAALAFDEYVKSVKKFTDEDYKELCFFMNDKVCSYMKNNKISAMGSTFASAYFDDGGAHICNVGDSGVFRFAQGSLDELTVEHKGIGFGSGKPGLTQFIGVPQDDFVIEPYITSSKCETGDRFLLCTDGLTDMLSRIELINIIGTGDLTQTAEKLKNSALNNGGIDNITFILIDVIDGGK